MSLEIGAYTADRALIAAFEATGHAQIEVVRPERTLVVLGRGSRPEVELDLEACREDGVPIVRRMGGGAAVVLDPGGLTIAVVLPVPGFKDSLRWFRTISEPLIQALEALGAPGVTIEGVSDLALGDRKMAGACLYRSRGLLYYSAFLLVEPAAELMERYLRHPPREPAYRRGRPHRDFVGALALALGPGRLEEVRLSLLEHLRERFLAVDLERLAGQAINRPV